MEARLSTGEKTKKMATTSRPSSPPPPEKETAAATATSEEEEQQQMERFYALVANVRALRAMFKEAALPSCREDDVSGGGGGEQRQKRPRAAPWLPAFEMADFECGGGGGGTTTDDIEAATTKKGKRSGANAAAEEDRGEVIEGKPVAIAIVADWPDELIV
uniref:Uncharacterized protein n=1 Tax=Oryza meridionalis TaxID=40149 RepID=A0A0E0C2Q5_9ORYZ